MNAIKHFLFLVTLVSTVSTIQAWSSATTNGGRSLAKMPPMLKDSKYDAESPILSRNEFFKSASLLASIVCSMKASPCNAVMTDPQTGISLPEEGEIAAAIPKNWDDVDNPLEDGDTTSLMGRLDSTPDSNFYKDPRFVEHVDDNAVQLMTRYISDKVLKKGDSVLDLCSSWTSHMDPGKKGELTRVAGLGMNAKELASNPSLTDYDVRDLNENPKLPYEDASFNVVLCQLSIDYLTKPLEVLGEAGRVLKPAGQIYILFSNRLFLSKAVALWTGKDDIDHAYTVGCYLHFCNGGFDNIVAQDLSTRKGRDRRIVGDPLYVVTATKR